VGVKQMPVMACDGCGDTVQEQAFESVHQARRYVNVKHGWRYVPLPDKPHAGQWPYVDLCAVCWHAESE
jgi:hypothetical protein